jgi:hypothetical protein
VELVLADLTNVEAFPGVKLRPLEEPRVPRVLHELLRADTMLPIAQSDLRTGDHTRGGPERVLGHPRGPGADRE